MPRVIFILRDGLQQEIEAEDGLSIMEVALNAGLRGISADCGGACQCATCHVYIDDPYLARLVSADENERDMIEGVAAPIELGSRLSCQVTVSNALDGIVVRIPETQ